MTTTTTNSAATSGTPKQRLFDIVAALIENINENNGEVTDELNALELDLEMKVEAYHIVIREKRARAKARKEAAQHFAQAAAVDDRGADALEERLAAAMLELGRERIETPTCTASFGKSQHVEIEDEGQFLMSAEDRFIRRSMDIINKAEIARALKAGETVEGAKLVETKHLRLR
jgi:hypothetical protein